MREEATLRTNKVEEGRLCTTRNGVYVMEVKVRRTPGGQVSTVDQNNEQDRNEQDRETVFRRLGHDLI